MFQKCNKEKNAPKKRIVHQGLNKRILARTSAKLKQFIWLVLAILVA
jgi:hypothetical protein